MAEQPRAVGWIVLAAFVVAIFGQDLFFSSGIGVNAFVFGAILSLGTFVLTRFQILRTQRSVAFMLAPAAVGFAGLLLNDSRGLDLLNVSLIAMSIGLYLIGEVFGQQVKLMGTWIGSFLAACLLPLIGFVAMFAVEWKPIVGHGVSPRLRSIGLGAFLGVPVLLVFGLILASADPVFGKMLSFSPEVDGGEVVTRLFVGGICGLFSLALWGLLNPRLRTKLTNTLAPPPAPAPPPLVVKTGTILEASSSAGPVPDTNRQSKVVNLQSNAAPHSRETPRETWGEDAPATRLDLSYALSTVLWLSTGLFSLFTIVQARYLFGGNDHVLQTSGLTFAEYARRGFFEISTVVAMAFPLALGCQSWCDAAKPRRVVIAAGAMIAATATLLVSAGYRMSLYVGAYGLTPLRFYVSLALLFFAIAFALYYVFGVRWQIPKFARSVCTAALGFGILANVARPDSVIASYNLSHQSTIALDRSMVIKAGADARGAIGRLGDAKLADEWEAAALGAHRDWKSMSISEFVAFSRVASPSR